MTETYCPPWQQAEVSCKNVSKQPSPPEASASGLEQPNRASLGSAAAGSEGQTETCKSLKKFKRKTVFKTVIRIPLWIPCLLQICAPVEIREFPPTAGRAAPTLHFRSCLRFFQTHPKATHTASDVLSAINSHNSRADSSPALLRSFTGKVSRKSSCGEKQDSTHTHTHTHLCICSQTLD